MKVTVRGAARPRFSQSSGFSLIELLIVVAIILIIAAIAIPSFLRSRMAANEASAATSIHGVNTGELVYASLFPAIGFSAALSDLGPAGGGACPGTAVASCVIDVTLATGTKSGYVFTYVQDVSSTPSMNYTVNGDPSVRGVTGQRSYYSDAFNVTHVNGVAPAGPADPPL